MSESVHNIVEQVKPIGDVASVATALGALTGFLPGIAAAFTIVWTGIRIYETRTVQNMLQRWRAKR